MTLAFRLGDIRRVIVMLIVVVGLVLTCVTPVPRAAAAASGDISVSITSIEPYIATLDSEVVVQAQVTNLSSTDLELQSQLHLSRVIIQQRTQIDQWLSLGTTDDPGTSIASQLVPVSAGKTRLVTFTVAPGALGLLTSPDGFGPRGISVTVSSASNENATSTQNSVIAITRSFLIWQPQDDTEVPNVDLAIAVPITGNSADIGTDTSASGRLTRILAATGDSPEVTWFVDPALVAAADGNLPYATYAEVSPTFSNASRHWAQAIRSKSALHSTYALDPFDADPLILASGRVPPPMSDSLRSSLDSITQFWNDGVAYPGESTPRRDLVQASWSLGDPTVIARRGYQATDPNDVSPGGVTSVTHELGTSKVLVSDPELAKDFTAPHGTTPAQAVQELLAGLSVIARDNPDEQRHVLLALPRTWTPDVATAQAQLAALSQVGFVNSMTVNEFANLDASETVRTTPKSSTTPDGQRLSASQWDSLTRLADQTVTFSHIAQDPQAISGPITDTVWQLSSLHWRDDVQTRDQLIDQLDDDADAVLQSQVVVLGSDVNLIAASSALPITIANNLDAAVTIRVRLVPDHPRLKTANVQPVTIEPHSEASVDIPVTAVGSGDVDVAVRLVATNGTVVSTPASFTVRVRADWESRGTIAVGGLLALLLVAGIWRTIRRGRAATRTRQGPDAVLANAQISDSSLNAEPARTVPSPGSDREA